MNSGRTAINWYYPYSLHIQNCSQISFQNTHLCREEETVHYPWSPLIPGEELKLCSNSITNAEWGLEFVDKMRERLDAIINWLFNAWLQIFDGVRPDLLELSCLKPVLADHQGPVQPFLQTKQQRLVSVLSYMYIEVILRRLMEIPYLETLLPFCCKEHFNFKAHTMSQMSIEKSE